MLEVKRGIEHRACLGGNTDKRWEDMLGVRCCGAEDLWGLDG